MAFDRSNSADLLALKNEVNGDPLGAGYLTQGTQGILDLLNNPANNLAPETGADSMTAEKLLKVIYPEAVNSQDQFKLQLLFEATGNLGSDLSLFKNEVSALSPALAAAVAGIIRDLSRAEVLFSIDDDNGVREKVYISRDDYLTARDS